jgi:DNA transformation protein
MSSDYVDFVLDALADWHTVTGRRMFGGYGLFRQGVMFALIIDETLYFKVDGSTRPAFEQAGSTPFVYYAKGKLVALSYWQVPPDLFEDSKQLGQWAQKAWQVALRAQALKPVSKTKKTSHHQGFDPDGP